MAAKKVQRKRTASRSRGSSSAKPAKKAAKKKTVKKKVATKKTGGGSAAKKRAGARAAPAGKTPGRKVAKKTGAAVRTTRARRPAAAKRKPTSPRRRKGPLKKWMPFREALLQRQRDLTHAYNASKGDSRSRLDDGTEDYIDYAVSSYAREFLLSLSEMDRKQLMLVEEAIRRIDSGGDYGKCLNCGQEIALKRLQVAPWARYCVRCQELDDQGLLAEPGVGLGDEDEDEDYDVVDFEDEDEDYDEDEELEDDDGPREAIEDGGGLNLEDDEDD